MAAFTLASSLGAQAAHRDSISMRPFGETTDGKSVSLYTLTNRNGVVAKITNYGGIVTSISVPDRKGNLGDVVLGFDNLASYIKSSPYFGALIGRYANRIAKGRYTLDGKKYQLFINNGVNSLHGGKQGFDKVVWTAHEVHPANGVGLSLSYVSKNAEEHYPGNLTTNVVYTLGNDNSLRIDYRATTDRDTILNLTSHSYFNLNGAGHGSILDNILTINADRFTPIDKTMIPTGKLESVFGTPFDFTRPTAIGKRIYEKNQQLIFAGGYDDNWVLNRHGSGLQFAARVYAPKTGRIMTVYTTEPGIQFYTGNFLDGTIIGKGGITYKKHDALALETQHFPDSPNHPNFPTTELKPGHTYRQSTIYKFSVR